VLIGYHLRFANKAGMTMGHEVDYSVQQEKARPLGRSLSDFGTLKPAEQTLLDSCRIGETAKISTTCPTESNSGNAVRAGFVRFLLLGGDNQTPIHEHGIQLRGAYIEGTLDLKATNVRYDFSITHSTFAKTLDLRDAKFNHSAALDSSEIPGINGRGLISEGKLSIRKVKSQRSVELQNAQIGGTFICSGASFDGKDGDALSFDGAVIKGNVFLNDGFKALGEVRFLGAQIGGQLICSGASFDGRHGDALSFDGAVIKGGVVLNDGFKALGKVRLLGAKIDGTFNCSGASFDGKDDAALSFDGAVIKATVFLNEGFKALGEVRLLGAKIDGTFNCSGASFDGKDGDALCFDRAVIKATVFLNEGFKALGKVRLLGAKIIGAFCCSGASFDGKDDAALSFDGAVIKGNVILNDGFTALGKVCFMTAQIDGQLHCRGASFDGKDGDALSFDGAVIKGNVILNDGFKSLGTVCFPGAQIDGLLDCSNSSFDGKDGDALSFARAVITGDVFLSENFKALGKVRLLGAHIDGHLDCSNASFDGKSRDALSFEQAVVKGNVYLRNNFNAMGKVTLVGAHIAGSLKCSGASFNGNGRVSLDANKIRLGGSLVLSKLKSPLINASFSGAKVAGLHDDEHTWGSDLDINGFVYDFIDTSAPIRANSRVAWLDKQNSSAAGTDDKIGADSKFCPQPWRQLQHVLREMGHIEEALEVGLALEHRLRKAGLIGQPPERCPKNLRWLYSAPARGLHYAYGALTGFGYRPIRLLVWSLMTWLACSSIYWWAASQEGVFAPSNPIVFQHDDYVSCRPDRESAWRKLNPAIVLTTPKEFEGPGNWYLCESLREEYTGFSPLAFSLDVLLPLVDLHQEKDWAPMVPTPKVDLTDEITAFGWKYFTRLVIWFQTLFGWVLSLLLVAIVSGLTRRRE
jgi:hypothetical protein